MSWMETVVVTGYRDPDPDPITDVTYTIDWNDYLNGLGDLNNGISTPPGDNGGGGGGGDSSNAGENSHSTPGGHTYTCDASLSSSQSSMLNKIVDYGAAHGYTAEQIKAAVDIAWYESKLGKFESNPDSTAKGVFQYLYGSWEQDHSDLDRGKDADQITAMYQDIDRYTTRYNNGEANGSIPADISFEEYLDQKHHEGNNSLDWYQHVAGFNSDTEDLSFDTSGK